MNGLPAKAAAIVVEIGREGRSILMEIAVLGIDLGKATVSGAPITRI